MKYEEVYLHDYQTVAEAVSGLNRYFAFYTHERPHQTFGGPTPAEVYGLTTPPWPLGINRTGDDAQRSAAASAFALRAHCEAAVKAETLHLNSTRCSPG